MSPLQLQVVMAKAKTKKKSSKKITTTTTKKTPTEKAVAAPKKPVTEQKKAPTKKGKPKSSGETLATPEKRKAPAPAPAAKRTRVSRRLSVGGVRNCQHCKKICNYGHKCSKCKNTFHVICMLSIQEGKKHMCIPCFEKKQTQARRSRQPRA